MIRLIVALDQERGIAKNGVQPWHLPSDERYFNQQTTSHGASVLQGNTTLAVIGHPLKNRRNFVLSRSTQPAHDGITYVTDLDTFLAELREDIWIIGGASLYAQTLERADEVYITKIDADFKCDKFFPEYESLFTLKSQSSPQLENGLNFTYCLYAK